MRGLVVGGILMTGPIWSFLLVVIGVGRCFALMRQERPPEPDQIFHLAQVSFVGLLAGHGAFAIGTTVLVLSLIAFTRNRERKVGSQA